MTKSWAEQAANVLLGKTIVKVRYITANEMRDLYWDRSGVVFELNDGTIVYPSQDDEGNGPGALFTSNENTPVIPVI